MPELAEVAYYLRQWEPGTGASIRAVRLHPASRVFRGGDPGAIRRTLRGRRYLGGRTHGKNLLFRFSDGAWLGGHLGMTGKLFTRESGNPKTTPATAGSEETTGGTTKAGSGAVLHRPGAPATPDPRHEHLVLVTDERALVFCDPRMFGRLTLHRGPDPPDWWRRLPPEILSPRFTRSRIAGFLARRRGTPIKSLLLEQSHFPGIGNWMADEILWRARLDPAAPAGSLTPDETALLRRVTRRVARDALRIIGTDWSAPPDSWLFNHRWTDGGTCPRPHCATPLVREPLRGRTTCWCPACQR